MRLRVVLRRVDHVIAGDRQPNEIGSVHLGDLDPAMMIVEHLARITPLATAVSEATGEATLERAARLTIGLLEAVMIGRLPIEQGLQCIEAGRKVTETIVHAELMLEVARFNAAPLLAPAPRDPSTPSRARPTWLRTAKE